MHLSKRLSIPVLASLLIVPLGLVASPADARVDHLQQGPRLPLGPRDLPERRTVEKLAPGLTLTTITRGRPDPAKEFWTIGISLPVGELKPDPDPDADTGSMATLAKAQSVATQLTHFESVVKALKASGFKPRVEAVDWAPRLRDYRGGLIGYTLRVGRYTAAPTDADPLFAALKASGFKAFAVHTAQDGKPGNTGPWVVRALTVDRNRFRGQVESTVGAAVSGQETTTAMAREAGAIAAINGGYFVINPADGTPGVPAGLSVVDGKVEAAATNGRVALVLGKSGSRPRIAELTSRHSVTIGRATHRVDGLNRLPGVIRNCGGVGGDTPTQRPVHDFTCADANETVALTPRYGVAPSAGPGVEAVVNRAGVITAVRPRTGLATPAGTTVVQAIGTDAAWLKAHAKVGARARVQSLVHDERGRTVKFGRTDSVVNGGPWLVHRGRVDVDPVEDGLVHEDPALGLPDSALGASFAYNWFIRDNPRTGAGIDAHGRLLLVQVDGRQNSISQGLSIMAFAQVMRSLGAVEAINLDGGGSSATVIRGQLVSSPSDSDAQGNRLERKDGDAIVVVPRR